jgi:hypothetical protein
VELERISSIFLKKEPLQRFFLSERPLSKVSKSFGELLVEYGSAFGVHTDVEGRLVDLIDRVEEHISFSGALLVAYAPNVTDEDAIALFIKSFERGTFGLVGDEYAGVDPVSAKTFAGRSKRATSRIC